MIEIGKNIGDFELESCWGDEITRTKLSDIEFETFQNNEIRKTRFENIFFTLFGISVIIFQSYGYTFFVLLVNLENILYLEACPILAKCAI